jgi:hypothetical protein
LSSHPRMVFLVASFFLANSLNVFLFSPMRATWHGLINLVIFAEKYKLLSSLCNFLQPHTISSHFSPINLLRTQSLNIFFYCHRPSFTPVQNYKQNYSFVYFNFTDIKLKLVQYLFQCSNVIEAHVKKLNTSTQFEFEHTTLPSQSRRTPRAIIIPAIYTLQTCQPHQNIPQQPLQTILQ